MKKKFLSILFSICTIVIIGCISASAETYGDFEYEVNSDNTITITDYTGSASNLTIPSKIDEKKVTVIGGEAFYECSSLTSVEIPDSVTTIGYQAFAISDNLESVNIPDSVTTIGTAAFDCCVSLATVEIPGSVTTIGDFAFYGCTSLNYIELPKHLEYLGGNAFYDVENLETVVALYEKEGIIDENTFDGDPVIYCKPNSQPHKDAIEYGYNYCLAIVPGDFVMAENTTSSIKLAWEKSHYADGYIIEQYIDGKWTRIKKITNPSTTSYTVSSLNTATAYKFRIRAYSKVDSVVYYSSFANLHVATKPGKVTAEVDAVSASSVRLTWNKVKNAGGYIIEEYKNGEWVRAARISGGDTTVYSIKDLKSGTTYKFRVKAFKVADGLGYYGESSATITTSTKPAKVNAKEDAVSGSSVRLTWNKISGAGGYIVEQYTNGKWTRVTKITDPATLKYSIKGLKSGTTYQFRVCAYKILGDNVYYGSYSDTVKTTTNPAKVVASVDAVSSSSVRLMWDKISGAGGYIIEQYKNGEWVRVARIGDADTLKYSIKGLSSATSYKFRVCSFKILDGKAYYGSYSTTVTAKTK